MQEVNFADIIDLCGNHEMTHFVSRVITVLNEPVLNDERLVSQKLGKKGMYKKHVI